MKRFQLHALNDDIRSDPADFIARCDGRYDRMVVETAQAAAKNIKNSPIILLAGPSGSGKTTTATRIRQELKRHGIGTHAVSLDDYYRNPLSPDYPKTEDGEPDLESPLGLDIPLLEQHLTDLAAGREITVPHFDFKTHSRDESKAWQLQLQPDEMVVFEGLHALNPLFTERHPHAFRIAISAASDLYDGDTLLLHHDQFRLLRRSVRDLYHRNAPALETLSLWGNVGRGERLYINPYRDQANVVLNTSLGYELSVLYPIAAPHYAALPADAPEMDSVKAIARAAQLVEPIDGGLVPQSSLMRQEFMQ